jgi:hypothetical protein
VGLAQPAFQSARAERRLGPAADLAQVDADRLQRRRVLVAADTVGRVARVPRVVRPPPLPDGRERMIGCFRGDAALSENRGRGAAARD